MSLERKAVRGAAWTIATSVGARIIGVIGTIVIANFIAPDIIGEVMVAVVLTLSARQLSIFGFGQYVVSKPDCGREAVFHATFFHLTLGTAALLLCLPLATLLGPRLGATELWTYMPGLVAAGLISRVGYMPHRILVRDLQFRNVSLVVAARELVFTFTSVALAVKGWGGMAIVAGNLARETVGTVAFVALAPRGEWLAPSKLNRKTTRDLFRFGTPLWLSTNAHFAAAWWDNLLMSGIFGTARMGLYNYAYNIANVPAVNIGEPIGDVLLPSFARLKTEKMADVLRRSTALLALIVFPLAVGLGVVAPTLVAAILPAKWQPMAPYLTVLSALSVARPIGWTVASYLQARDRPVALMWLELFKLGCAFRVDRITRSRLWADLRVRRSRHCVRFTFARLAHLRRSPRWSRCRPGPRATRWPSHGLRCHGGGGLGCPFGAASNAPRLRSVRRGRCWRARLHSRRLSLRPNRDARPSRASQPLVSSLARHAD